MLEKQNGRSIIWLLLLVIIIVAIIMIGIKFFAKEFTNKESENISTDMLRVQAKAKIIYEQYHMDNAKGLKGEKTDDTGITEKYGIEDITKYYKWNKDILNEVGLNDIELLAENYFLVNYETGEVIYSKGYETENKEIYYKLSEIENLIEK